MRLLNLPWLDLVLRLGEDAAVVSDAKLNLHSGRFGVSEYLDYYQTISPLLLFNQDNYKRYQTMNDQEQRSERNRLLVSNLLMALRRLEMTFPERLYATFVTARTQIRYYKGKKIIGISGELMTNVVIPDGFACGHAVSHGFGELIAG